MCLFNELKTISRRLGGMAIPESRYCVKKKGVLVLSMCVCVCVCETYCSSLYCAAANSGMWFIYVYPMYRLFNMEILNG